MATKRGPSDSDRLREALSSLDVTICVDEDGHYTVYTTVEPLFCFERDTLNEIRAVVVDTLRSYAENFYNVRGVRFSVETPAAGYALPIEKLLPYSKVRPQLEFA